MKIGSNLQLINMFNPGFQIQIDTAVIDYRQPSGLNSITEILIEQEINGAANRLTLVLGESNELSVNRGDSVIVNLGYEEELITVFKGEVDRVIPEIEQRLIKCADSGQCLLSLRINQTFEELTSGEIVGELASSAGVSDTKTDPGIELPSFVIDAGKNGFEHILDLAQKNGFDFYIDTDDQLVFKQFKTSNPVRTFLYGQDILKVEIFQQIQEFQKVEVRGESPASSQGIEKAHFLVKSFEDLLGTAGDGSPVLNIQDPVVKTRAVADTVAAAAFNEIERKAIRGRIKTLGAPDIKLADIIGIEEVPGKSLNGSFQVRGISHIFNESHGFISHLMIRSIGN